jgi:hypothetical protein
MDSVAGVTGRVYDAGMTPLNISLPAGMGPMATWLPATTEEERGGAIYYG